MVGFCLLFHSCVEYRDYFVIQNGIKSKSKEIHFDAEGIHVVVSAKYRLGLRIQSTISYEITNECEDTIRVVTDKVRTSSLFYRYILCGANIPDRIWNDEKPVPFKNAITVLPRTSGIILLYFVQENLSKHGMDENEVLTLMTLGIFKGNKELQADSITFVVK